MVLPDASAPFALHSRRWLADAGVRRAFGTAARMRAEESSTAKMVEAFTHLYQEVAA